jgi:hypothetical protein
MASAAPKRSRFGPKATDTAKIAEADERHAKAQAIARKLVFYVV